MYQRFISILIKKLDDAINLKSYYFLEVLYILAIYVDLGVVYRSFQSYDNHGVSKYLMDTYHFLGPLMMHMSHILVF